jgi:hypothetical protein
MPVLDGTRRRLSAWPRLRWRLFGGPSSPVDARVGAENLRHQAIFVNHAPSAIAPLDPELIQIRDAVGQLP